MVWYGMVWYGMEWEEGFKEIVVSIPENNSLKNILVPKKRTFFKTFPTFTLISFSNISRKLDKVQFTETLLTVS